MSETVINPSSNTDKPPPTDNHTPETATKNGITPKKRCNHLKIKQKTLTKAFKQLKCAMCQLKKPNNDILQLCLTCGLAHCARNTNNEHAIKHSKKKAHFVVLKIPTFRDINNYKENILLDIMELWCYKCDEFLKDLGMDHTNNKSIKKMKSHVLNYVRHLYKKNVCWYVVIFRFFYVFFYVFIFCIFCLCQHLLCVCVMYTSIYVCLVCLNSLYMNVYACMLNIGFMYIYIVLFVNI